MTTLEQPTPTANAAEDRIASIVAMVLRMLLMGSAALAIAWPLTPSGGRWAAVIGAVLGVWMGEKSGRSRLRRWVLFVGPLLGLGGLYVLTQSWVYWDWPSQLFGWSGALQTAEFLRWGGGSLIVVATLRAYGRRYAALNSIELLLPVVAAASLLSAHRDGQIHRPQQLADWALEQGQDPTWYLLLFGLAGALFLAFGLLRLRRSSQLFGGLAVIALLFTFAFWGLAELPYRQLTQSVRKMLGGQGKPKKRKPRKAKAKPRRQGQSRGQRRRKKDQQMPFQPNQKQQKQNQRRRPVAMVVFRSDYKPVTGVYYFRQQVLSQFNDVRMVESHSLNYDRDRAEYYPGSEKALPISRSIEWSQRPKDPTPSLYKIKKKAKSKKYQGKNKKKDATRSYLEFFYGKKSKKKKKIYAEVVTQVSLLQKHQRPFALVSAQALRGLPNPNNRLFLRSYEVRSKAWNRPWKLDIKFGEEYWPKNVWKHYTQAPTDPRYKDLQQKILERLKNTKYENNIMAKAYVIKTWLEKNAAYSMRIRTPQSVTDHVGYFLFKTRVGYCVHFSHAAVYLLRLTGVPARIAEGYAAPMRYRGNSSALLLRSAEAHAWPEVYVRGVGWVPFDIQPKRSLDPTARPPDPDLRRLYSNLARPKYKLKGKKSPYMMGTRRSLPWLKYIKTTFYVVFTLAWMSALLLLALGYLLKLIRRFGYLFVPAGARRNLHYYRSITDRLSELGDLREPGESLEAYAYRLRDKLPALETLTSQITAVSLGSQLPQDDTSVLRDLSRQMRSAYPWYRQLVQIPRPFAWSRHIWQHWRFNPPPALLKWNAFWDRVGAVMVRVLPMFRRTPT
ncbi:MAG: transglutaminase domain-containing protein [Deltaproteobacteria bacterium]|nr:MAG: transglutaminase domain-containing protein [Deltaproteobacteria bacterium]